MMKEWLLVLKTADAAARWHVHQRRKGAAKEPYINHLLEVAMLVADATDGTNTDLVIAALLHDAIEDSEVPRKTIADAFGEDVASFVMEVTDDKTVPKSRAEAKANRKRWLEYVQWAQRVVEGLRGVSPNLEQKFDEAARAAERSFTPTL